MTRLMKQIKKNSLLNNVEELKKSINDDLKKFEERKLTYYTLSILLSNYSSYTYRDLFDRKDTLTIYIDYHQSIVDNPVTYWSTA